jgi:hypothetical protein
MNTSRVFVHTALENFAHWDKLKVTFFANYCQNFFLLHSKRTGIKRLTTWSV